MTYNLMKQSMASKKYTILIPQTVKINRKCQCSTCKGSKSKPGTQPQKCGTCQGSGYMSMRQGMMVLRAVCNSCQGEGKKITNPCTTCKGTGAEVK